MPLVKVKRFAQVTLPSEVRKRFKIVEGDYLEAEAVNNGILLKPVSVVEKEGWRELFDVIDRVASRKPQSRKRTRLEEEEIAEIIKQYRKTSRKRRPNA